MPYLVPEEDTLSLAESATHFHEYDDHCGGTVDIISELSDLGSCTLASDFTVWGGRLCVLQMALKRLNLAMKQQAEPALASAFIRQRPTSAAFAVTHQSTM